MSRWTFTSESVTEGHPDKMADQISDTVLDAILAEDPNGRVACETLLTTGLCVVAGEITTSAYVDIPKLARQMISEIGYDNALYGFDGNTCGVIVSIDEQSPNIAQGVDTSEELRGGTSGEDQINLPGRRRPGDDVRLRLRRDRRPDAAADLARPPPGRAPGRGAQVRRRCRTCVPTARPRSRSSTRTARPIALKTVLISTQHQEGIDRDTVIRPDLIEQVIRPTIPAQFADDDYEVYDQPDRQVRARRPARRHRPHRSQDHRRHLRRHGPSRRRRVQRQGPEQGRPVGGLRGALGRQARRRQRAPPTRCEVQVAYAIGMAHPMSILVETFGTNTVDPRTSSSRPCARCSTCARPRSCATST